MNFGKSLHGKIKLWHQKHKKKRKQAYDEAVAIAIEKDKANPNYHPYRRFIVVQACFLIVYFVVTTFFVQGLIAVGDSMQPTYTDGTSTWLLRIFSMDDIDYGEILTFKAPELGDSGDGTLYMKRVVGLPGDHISLSDGGVVRNGELLTEPYLAEGTVTVPTGNGLTEFVVPDNSLFLLGDNRLISNDSRNWENPYVAFEDISGVMICSMSPSLGWKWHLQ